MKTKSIATGALFLGLLLGLVGILALNYGRLTPGHLEMGSASWFIVFGAALMTGYIDTCVGGGHGTILTPILVLVGFPATMVVPAILLSEIGIGLLATILNHRAGNIHLAQGGQHRRVLLVLSICAFVGSIIAVTAAVKLPPKWVDLYIGLVVIAVGLLLLFGRHLFQGFSMKRIAVLGTIASFNKGISGGGFGPLLTSGQVLSGVSEKGAVSITPPARGLTGFISVVMYFIFRGRLELGLALPLILGSLLAIPAAVLTVKAIDAAALRKGIILTTLVLGSLLVIRALH